MENLLKAPVRGRGVDLRPWFPELHDHNPGPASDYVPDEHVYQKRGWVDDGGRRSSVVV